MNEAQWDVYYNEAVTQKDIPALDSAVKARILKAIKNKLARDPFHFGKPLRYSEYNLRTSRVGDYRILYRIDKDRQSLLIVAIGHRRDIYERVD